MAVFEHATNIVHNRHRATMKECRWSRSTNTHVILNKRTNNYLVMERLTKLYFVNDHRIATIFDSLGIAMAVANHLNAYEVDDYHVLEISRER